MHFFLNNEILLCYIVIFNLIIVYYFDKSWQSIDIGVRMHFDQQ
jgi:hypothetical protein